MYMTYNLLKTFKIFTEYINLSDTVNFKIILMQVEGKEHIL